MNATRKIRARLLAVAVAVLTALCAGVAGPAQPAAAATFVPITGAGSTWSYPAIHAWIVSLNQFGLPINYQPNGSAVGLTFFAGGQSDWAASEYPYGTRAGSSVITPPGRGFAYMPDTAGGLGFMYNLSIGGQRVTNLRLSGAVIAGIFTNQITMWNDPRIAADNPGLTMPALAITPVVRSDTDGSTETFTQWMAATQGSAWTAYCQSVGLLTGPGPCPPTTGYPVQGGTGMIGQPGDPGVATFVAQSSSNGAIGYVPYSWALQEGFPVAKVLNAAGYYTLPSAANVGVSLLDAQSNADGSANLSPVYADTDPRAYELSYYSYLIVPTDLTNGMTTDKGYTLGTFGQYLLCQGQNSVTPLGYAPLPINLVEDGFAQLAKIPGASLPATTAAAIAGCNNPTFAPDGTDTLAANTPLPPACDQQGATQCASTAGTVVILTASPNPATANNPVILTATVTAGPSVPAGAVQFVVGSTLIGLPVTVGSTGVATTTTTFSAAGTDTVSARFVPADPAAVSSAIGVLSLTVLPNAGSGVIPLAATVPLTGTFTLTVDAADTGILVVSGNTATAALTPITVTDTRNSYPGWAVSGHAADFTGSGTAAGFTISGNQLGWTPTGSSLAPGVTLGGTVTPGSPGLGDQPGFLASAHSGAGSGFGTSTFGANLTLLIPPTPASAAGSYTSTLNVDAETSLP
jgi:ABC-type phosphate transport system substrate-binding protein